MAIEAARIPAVEIRAPNRPLTDADLEDVPYDGRRFELLDGALIVSPSPSFRHQIAIQALLRLLDRVVTAPHRLIPGPIDIRMTRPGETTTTLAPDIVIAVPPVDPVALVEPPLLVVEVLSPSNRRTDLYAKRAAYGEFGIPHYWMVDPTRPIATMTGLQLVDGTYQVAAAATGGEQATFVAGPYEITVSPEGLLT